MNILVSSQTSVSLAIHLLKSPMLVGAKLSVPTNVRAEACLEPAARTSGGLLAHHLMCCQRCFNRQTVPPGQKAEAQLKHCSLGKTGDTGSGSQLQFLVSDRQVTACKQLIGCAHVDIRNSQSSNSKIGMERGAQQVIMCSSHLCASSLNLTD